MKMLLYCTKAKPYLVDLRKLNCGFQTWDCDSKANLNGKIVAECDFEVEEIFTQERGDDGFSSPDYLTETLSADELADKSCLTYEELDDYLDTENGYAIHIKNLHIFDEPKKTCEYNTYNRNGKVHIANIPIYTAPQNMMYAFDYYGNPFVLISIKPEWLCKILNGEKTIEVRRKVLKEML